MEIVDESRLEGTIRFEIKDSSKFRFTFSESHFVNQLFVAEMYNHQNFCMIMIMIMINFKKKAMIMIMIMINFKKKATIMIMIKIMINNHLLIIKTMLN